MARRPTSTSMAQRHGRGTLAGLLMLLAACTLLIAGPAHATSTSESVASVAQPVATAVTSAAPVVTADGDGTWGGPGTQPPETDRPFTWNNFRAIATVVVLLIGGGIALVLRSRNGRR